MLTGRPGSNAVADDEFVHDNSNENTAHQHHNATPSLLPIRSWIFIDPNNMNLVIFKTGMGRRIMVDEQFRQYALKIGVAVEGGDH